MPGEEFKHKWLDDPKRSAEPGDHQYCTACMVPDDSFTPLDKERADCPIPLRKERVLLEEEVRKMREQLGLAKNAKDAAESAALAASGQGARAAAEACAVIVEEARDAFLSGGITNMTGAAVKKAFNDVAANIRAFGT